MTRRGKPPPPRAAWNDEPMPRRRATATPTEGRLALVEGKANSRMFVYLIGNYLHRIEQERRGLYAGDLDLAVVAEMIGASSPACATPPSATGTGTSSAPSRSTSSAR